MREAVAGAVAGEVERKWRPRLGGGDHEEVVISKDCQRRTIVHMQLIY